MHNRAYSARDLDQQLNAAMRRWLARADLNRFSPEDRAVTLSKIFSWYGADFNKADAGLAAVLARYAPERYHEFLKSGQ